MTRNEVFTRLQAVFDEVFFDKVVLRPELTAKDVPEWDSVSHISLVIAVERAFSIRFRLGEVVSARNVGEFIDLILRCSAAASSEAELL